MRVFNQRAFTLISRPYSETSSIVEVFTKDYGRIGLMAKGAKRIKSKVKGVLQPFQPVLLSWTGKGEVPTLTSAEIDLEKINLFRHDVSGDRLVCAFYCNELLMSLIHRHDPHPKLFEIYQDTVLQMGIEDSEVSLANNLRNFEQSIMKEAGYEVSFLTESDGKTLIEDHSYYSFQAGQGFVRETVDSPNNVKGVVIKSLYGANHAPSDPEIASEAKRLMRRILVQTMGKRNIVSRELFSLGKR